ncbi:MAG TPA: hypothetical protein VHY09_12430 [Candidatus Methylacidiphilales bacterium]|jgi:hypothetical protein|nr:hypothetical protein [Candidatus Methylacidiphilales bacterium]
MNTSLFSKTDCALRRDRYFERATQAARTWYDADGNWISPSLPSITRERYWLSLALYAQGEAALADAVIRKGKLGYVENGRVVNFDIFHTNISSVLLHQHRDKMADDVRRSLEERVREGFAFEPGNRRCDFQIHGYNDNMPAEATLGLILGGELLGDKDAVEHGVWNLRQLRAMLYRRGINSEWNSPTYSPLTLHCIAEVAEHARHPEARELAMKIEERLWIDIAGRFHPEIGVVGAPHARAYIPDALAHLSIMSSMLWFVLGEASRPSPMELFNPDSGLVLHHEGDVPFNVAQMCVFASDAYHPPQKAMELFGRKNYPFRAVATAEVGDGTPDFPAAATRLETVLLPDFSVGTSSIAWIGGEQTEAYGVVYKRAKEVRSFRDVGVVYHKFLINDDEPGKIIFPKDEHGKTCANSGEQYLGSRCSLTTVQSEASVLIVTAPLLYLAGVEDTRPPMPLTRLSEMVTFPSHFGGADEVRIGGKALESWSGEARHGEWIGCRRGRLLIAIRPLASTADLGPVSVKLEKINNYEVIRTNFYQGPSRNFTRFDLRRIYGGFVAEHASIDDYPSLAAFMEELAPSKFTDQYLTTRRVRYRRPAGRRKALELEVSWSPGGAVTRFSTVNGRVPSIEPPVQIDGLEQRDIPILNEPWSSVPPYFPWPALRAPCNKHDGTIADRED